MPTGPNRRIVPAFALLLALASGCAQPGPIFSRQATLGTLKSTVSQLEFDNEKLRKQVAELKAENVRIGNRLDQEEDANGELAARLDDAKDLIRRQGGDATALGIPSKSLVDNEVPPPYSNPPARRIKKRNPPSASIPRSMEPPTPSDDLDDPRSIRDPGPQTRADDERWLPVARGLGATVRQ